MVLDPSKFCAQLRPLSGRRHVRLEQYIHSRLMCDLSEVETNWRHAADDIDNLGGQRSRYHLTVLPRRTTPQSSRRPVLSCPPRISLTPTWKDNYTRSLWTVIPQQTTGLELHVSFDRRVDTEMSRQPPTTPSSTPNYDDKNMQKHKAIHP